MPINSEVTSERQRPSWLKERAGSTWGFVFWGGVIWHLLLEVELRMEIFSSLVETPTNLGSSQPEAGFLVFGRKSVCIV